MPLSEARGSSSDLRVLRTPTRSSRNWRAKTPPWPPRHEATRRPGAGEASCYRESRRRASSHHQRQKNRRGGEENARSYPRETNRWAQVRKQQTHSEQSNDMKQSSEHGHVSPKINSNFNEISFTAKELIDLVKTSQKQHSVLENHFSIDHNAIPEFDPAKKEQTINMWLNKVEECAELYKWSEAQLLHYSLPKLVGVAKVWYEGLPSVAFTWAEWKNKLVKTFPDVQNYEQLLQEMLDKRAKFNEPLETYFFQKMNLVNRCNITGKQAVDCLIYGLEDREVRLGAQAVNCTQPEELLVYLKSVKVEDPRDKESDSDSDIDKEKLKV